MNKYEELKKWADKWKIIYVEQADDRTPVKQLYFEGVTWNTPVFSYNSETDQHIWLAE